MEYIELKKDNLLRIGIKTDEGVDTGNELVFDLEDIELPLRMQQCLEEHKNNVLNIKNQFVIIDKREDKKGKKLLSANEEAKIKAMKEFYDKEIKCLDMFLGEGGTLKILNGRKPYFTMFDDINEYLEPIKPLIQNTTENIKDKIIKKYKTNKDDVMTDE